ARYPPCSPARPAPRARPPATTPRGPRRTPTTRPRAARARAPNGYAFGALAFLPSGALPRPAGASPGSCSSSSRSWTLVDGVSDLAAGVVALVGDAQLFGDGERLEGGKGLLRTFDGPTVHGRDDVAGHDVGSLPERVSGANADHAPTLEFARREGRLHLQ